MRCYCNGLKGNYGNYNFKTVVPEFLPVMIDYNHLERKRWTYAPERQLFEMLFEYCNNNKLELHKTIKSVECCMIVR